MYYLYILESKKNKRRYVGSTSNLKRRLLEHNNGQGGKYTHDNRPFVLIYYEAYINKLDAIQAEKFYKTGYGREILAGKLSHFLLA
ncbi:MAG: excinuclease ABC subunit C [Candidatus Vogelbacteria bacterium CG22_combo_CG10-13_8_21_14_all_37_9]|uniref:Excinuclease ABC subunit C n=1 Tax=Candidatus Vogelbacteria bacterium CG22_combo_CG10-13_8_21_14_all_37_9 TaxID=1975046 RepID=A0A2H0BKC0_9BACT|nr:MAG: excinuclease ABC subunit C [Candidatus Vogelbacteria bacterium CG22_combo_CG10-13_8_21_14_all_37_9]